MRISFSGASCTGKTTTINHFLQRWNNYSLIKSKYRKLIKDKNHSKNTTAKLQKEILNVLCEETEPYTLHQNVIYDRCPLDNLIYSMWAYDKGIEGFTDKFMEESMGMVKKSMEKLDIIFVCTRDLMPPLVENNNIRETDIEYIKEIDNFFKAIIQKYKSGVETLPFFDKGNAPAIIDIYGQPFERMAQIAMYVTEEGGMFGEDESLIDINELGKMQDLLREQKEEYQKEKMPLIK